MHCIGPSANSLRVSTIVRSNQRQLYASISSSLRSLAGVGARQQVRKAQPCNCYTTAGLAAWLGAVRAHNTARRTSIRAIDLPRH